MTRGALLPTIVLTLGLAAWPITLAIGAGDPASSVASIREALANVHRTDCRARQAAGAFDYQEITRRALGRHWRDRTEAERVHLVELLRGHVITWYSRFCERQEFVHFGPTVVDGDRALLSARAIREGRAVSVVYRLRSPDTKRWLVYDVEVAGRSHARTLYAEFDRILLNEGYRDLVARLVDEQDRPRAAVTRLSR